MKLLTNHIKCKYTLIKNLKDIYLVESRVALWRLNLGTSVLPDVYSK